VYAWLVERIVRRGYESFNRRRPEPVLRRFAADVHFRFAGEHDLAIDSHSREEVERWFERLFELLPDIQFAVEEVVVKGPPWNTRVCTRYVATATAPAGGRLVNHGVQFAHLSWGRVRSDLLYPDTQAVAIAVTSQPHHDDTPGTAARARSARG
jgi:ketosteroid isomerase-like protein